jgi:hypothetical protein
LRSTSDLVEGTNLYYTDARARAAFTAGTGITISTGTIATTITQYTDELAQDASASLFTTGTHTGISYSYNDASNKIDSTVSLSGFSIDALSDVDTSTTAPTNGQALAWSSSGSKWIPTTISGGGGSGGGDITWLADVTANNTVLTLDASNSMALVKNGSSAWTVYLPAISGKNGRLLRIKRLGSGLVTIAVNSGDTTKFIDVSGTTSVAMGVQYGTFDLVANELDGAWYLL